MSFCAAFAVAFAPAAAFWRVSLLVLAFRFVSRRRLEVVGGNRRRSCICSHSRCRFVDGAPATSPPVEIHVQDLFVVVDTAPQTGSN